MTVGQLKTFLNRFSDNIKILVEIPKTTSIVFEFKSDTATMYVRTGANVKDTLELVGDK